MISTAYWISLAVLFCAAATSWFRWWMVRGELKAAFTVVTEVQKREDDLLKELVEATHEWDESARIIAALNQEIAELRKSKRVASESTLPILACPPMSEEERRFELSKILPETPVWRVVNECLVTEIFTALDKVSDAKMAEHTGSLTHAAGGLEYLMAFRSLLETERISAHRVKQREEKRAA